MALNIPTTDTNRFSFGPGTLELANVGSSGPGAVTEASDFSDVGGVRSGATFAVTRTKLDVFQGSPRNLVKTFVQEETATLTVNGIEWDLSSLAQALGAATAQVVTDADVDLLKVGGDMNMASVAVRYIHVMPSGYTLSIRIWEAQGNGDVTVTFGDDLHEIPYVFNAVHALSEWDGANLSENEHLFRIALDKV